MKKLQSILKDSMAHWWGWLILSLPLVAIVLFLTISTAAEHMVIPTTEAAPLTEKEVTFDMEANQAYTADDGLVLVKSKAAVVQTFSAASTVEYPPDKVWENDHTTTYHQFTMPEKVQRKDGSIGILTIPSLDLSVNVFETDDQMEDMSHGIAHFKSTSAWQGNIGLSAHNINFDLTDGYFRNLFLLQKGDEVIYNTQYGEQKYQVATVAEIAENDWSYLGRTEDNRITMITCISGKPNLRLCVQALEKE